MGCGLRRATSLFDGLHFVGFYCLPAFVGEQQQQQQQPPSPPTSSSSSSLQSKQPTPLPAYPCSAQPPKTRRRRAAARTQGPVIQRPPAGRRGELERLLFPPLLLCASPHRGPRPPLLEVARGFRFSSEKPGTNLSVWHGMAAGPEPS